MTTVNDIERNSAQRNSLYYAVKPKISCTLYGNYDIIIDGSVKYIKLEILSCQQYLFLSLLTLI